MALGILRDRVMEHVPGTTRLEDEGDRTAPWQSGSTMIAGLKYDTSGPVPIILVPQPSDDPNDPLNWPLWKRDVIILVLSITSIFATSLGSILAANTLTLSLDFSNACNCSVPFTQIAQLTGYFLLGVGASAIFFVPSARVWGKRHLYLLGTVIIIFSSAWGGASTSYGSLLGARLVQGIGTAPFEALVNVSVGDLYFVHQRGKRMAFTTLAVFGGAFFTPIVVGKITDTIGWPWSFYFVSIFTAVCLPLVFFFVPETAFSRSSVLNTDLVSGEDIRLFPQADAPEQQQPPPTQGTDDASQVATPTVGESYYEKSSARLDDSQLPSGAPGATPPPTASWAQTLLPFNGRKSNESYWKLLLRPFPLFAHPAIFWGCLIQGATIGWTVFIGIILAAIFLGPPLFWNEVKTGYGYTGAFVGAIVGFIIAGVLADWSAKLMTRRNHGIYEPEFRIVLVIPQLIFGCCGLYAFGVVGNNLSAYPHLTPIVFFGFEVMGMVIGAVAASLYIVDAHRDIAIEAFTCLIIFKNFFSFGLTFSAYDWLVNAGTIDVFLWISSVQVFVCLLSIPMYVLGKKNRSFFHRHDILRICGLR